MRRLGALAVLAAGFAFAPLGFALAAPDDTAVISHVEAANGEISVLVSVPAGASVELDDVALTVGGAEADASAAIAGSASTIRRTTVLAIDTSDSMAGARFAAARSAATTFLSSVPDDVEVGIVTFDGRVQTLLEPTTDRAAATEVVAGLSLARGTLLYDGVLAAVEQLGTEGQRSVLLLSDGKNTNRTALATVTEAVAEAGVQLDAVALDQAAGDLGPLQSMVTAGEGQLVPADPAALEQAFAAEAAVLARQVLVTADVPEAVTALEGDVEVTLPIAGGTPLTASTYTVIREAAPGGTAEVLEDAANSLQLPPTALYGGLAAIGLGLVVLLAGLMSAAAGGRERTVEQRIAAYGPAAAVHGGQRKGDPASFNLAQAKDAAASMLQRNKGLEARIEKRLEAAGSALTAPEWLLLHGLIAILAGLVGLLLGGGSIFLLLVGLVLGALLPWLWLGHKRKKRVAAFNSGLADTLQLIAGSLSAGMSLAQAIDAVVNEGNEPIAGEFKRVLIESRLGVPLETALEGIAQRIDSVDFAWVVMAIRIQREVGGNLAELLTTVAGTLRERDYLRRQVQTLSAEGRLSAYILIALPLGMAAYMFMVRREYIHPLYTTGIGIVMLGAFVVLLGFGWFVMNRIVKVEV
jgi:tight adherence protein B